MTPAQLDELRELEKNAIPAEWQVSEVSFQLRNGDIWSRSFPMYDTLLVTELRNHAKELIDMAEWALKNGYKPE